MAEDNKTKPEAKPEAEPKAKVVFCVRNQCDKAAAEHLGCPYCFGKKKGVIEAGDRKEFCDFDPEKDPTSFGFPEDSSRNLKG